MARYFFHIADHHREPDHEGTECPDHAAARKAAIRFAGALMSDEPDLLWDGRDLRVEVTDEQNLLVFTVVMIAVDGAHRGPDGEPKDDQRRVA